MHLHKLCFGSPELCPSCQVETDITSAVSLLNPSQYTRSDSDAHYVHDAQRENSRFSEDYHNFRQPQVIVEDAAKFHINESQVRTPRLLFHKFPKSTHKYTLVCQEDLGLVHFEHDTIQK